MDATQKRAGVPFSTSRKGEKAAKKNTHKKRRQEDAASARKGASEWLSWRKES